MNLDAWWTIHTSSGVTYIDDTVDMPQNVTLVGAGTTSQTSWTFPASGCYIVQGRYYDPLEYIDVRLTLDLGEDPVDETKLRAPQPRYGWRG